MAEENTHSAVVNGAGSTAAGDTTIGTITLPADGPWLIHHVFALIARATATAAEMIGGHFRLESAQGDMEPNPAPSRFPLYEAGSFLGATAEATRNALQIYPVNYAAPGRASVNMIYNQAIACTAAAQVVLGIMYGRTRPEAVPIQFCDRVRATVTTVAATSIGTITLSERATRITNICGIIMQDGVLVAGEELIGYFYLTSDDIDLVPAQYPFLSAMGAGLGATIGSPGNSPVQFLPVDIPVPAGARINVFAILNTAVTNGADVEVFLGYE